MPRYVLLRHECDHLRGGSHWDLMLERNGTLATWALNALPSPWVAQLAKSSSVDDSVANDPVAATKLPDHRVAYLDYEGPVSERRGSVTRVAAGTYTVSAWSEDRIAWVFAKGDLVGAANAVLGSGNEWVLTAATDASR